MSSLVKPHGSPELKPLLLEGAARTEEIKRTASLPKVTMTSRETSDLIMMGIGAFTPLEGSMGKADWQGVCREYEMASGLFWPVPITLSASEASAGSIRADGFEHGAWPGEDG